MSNPCKGIPFNDSLREIAGGAIHNLDCLSKFEVKLEDLRTWKKDQELIYNKKD